MARWEGERPRIESYRDVRRFVRKQSARSLQPLYDSAYFERHVGNVELARRFFEHAGLEETEYTARPLAIAGVAAGDDVLDIGCGRGEVVLQSAARGARAVGVDFSESALAVARAAAARVGGDIPGSTTFLHANAEELPLADASFDVVFLLDVVEHLAPPELAAVLGEARRVLRPAGKAVIHTTPNRWSRTYGHALRSAAALVRGRRPPVHPLVADFRRLDADPRYDAMKALLHVNEQSVASLWWALRRAGFAPRVWLAEDGNRWRGRTDRAGAALSRLYRVTQLRYVFGWSMFAVASPRA